MFTTVVFRFSKNLLKALVRCHISIQNALNPFLSGLCLQTPLMELKTLLRPVGLGRIPLLILLLTTPPPIIQKIMQRESEENKR